jgi:hypothetical protein
VIAVGKASIKLQIQHDEYDDFMGNGRNNVEREINENICVRENMFELDDVSDEMMSNYLMYPNIDNPKKVVLI